jgi:predicted nucleic-acid-binding protein
MRAVDTNVLVRLATRDDPAQAAAAERFVAAGAWVSHVVLAEFTWVLRSVYGAGARELAAAIQILLSHEHLILQDAGTVRLALASFRKRPSLSFSDCLIVEIARKAGHGPLGTFDRGLGKLGGVDRL